MSVEGLPLNRFFSCLPQLIETEKIRRRLRPLPLPLSLTLFYFPSEHHFQGTTFVSFSSVISTLKLKTHSQLTQSPCKGTGCLFHVKFYTFYLLIQLVYTVAALCNTHGQCDQIFGDGHLQQQKTSQAFQKDNPNLGKPRESNPAIACPQEPSLSWR